MTVIQMKLFFISYSISFDYFACRIHFFNSSLIAPALAALFRFWSYGFYIRSRGAEAVNFKTSQFQNISIKQERSHASETLYIGRLRVSPTCDLMILKFKNMKQTVQDNGPSGAVYGLGFIGAAIYFISTAGSFWMGVLGVLKAMIWPAYLVYGLLAYMGM